MFRCALQYATMTSASTPPKKRGCFFYGCLVLVILGLIFIVLMVGGYLLLKKTASGWFDDQPTPMLVEGNAYSSEQMADLERRLKPFQESLEQGGAPVELTLTADDLNALIAKSPVLRGKLFVILEAD